MKHPQKSPRWRVDKFGAGWIAAPYDSTWMSYDRWFPRWGEAQRYADTMARAVS